MAGDTGLGAFFGAGLRFFAVAREGARGETRSGSGSADGSSSSSTVGSSTVSSKASPPPVPSRSKSSSPRLGWKSSSKVSGATSWAGGSAASGSKSSSSTAGTSSSTSLSENPGDASSNRASSARPFPFPFTAGEPLLNDSIFRCSASVCFCGLNVGRAAEKSRVRIGLFAPKGGRSGVLPSRLGDERRPGVRRGDPRMPEVLFGDVDRVDRRVLRMLSNTVVGSGIVPTTIASQLLCMSPAAQRAGYCHGTVTHSLASTRM